MENNNALKLTLLRKEQVRFGRKQLKIFKKYGKRSSVTDFAILLGCIVSDNFYVRERRILKDRAGGWWTSSSYLGAWVFSVDNDSSYGGFDSDRRTCGIRPAVSYSAIKDFSMNKVFGECDLLEIEFGEYPQMVVEKKLGERLEERYVCGELEKTGKQYTVDSVFFKDYTTEFYPRHFDEYEYEGKKYIGFVGDKNGCGKKLSDGSKIVEGTVYWIEVAPIIWQVDEKNDIALCKKSIVSGIPFDIKDYKGNFLDTVMYEFMNKYLVKDIMPFGKEIFKVNEEIIEVVNDKSEEVIEAPEEVTEVIEDRISFGLINGIKEQLDLIKEHDDKVNEVSLRVNMLLDNYNEDIGKTRNKSLLVIGDQTIACLRKNLFLELEDILDDLKRLNNSLKVYYEVRDYLGKLLKILNKQEVKIDTGLMKDIKVISDVVIPFLNVDEQEKMKKVFSNIIEEELQKVNMMIFRIVSGEKSDNQEYKNINEYELLMRRKIHSGLEILNERVMKCDAARRILEGTRQIIEKRYQYDKTNIISFYVNVMNDLYQDIVSKYQLSREENELLLEVIQTRVDTDKNIHVVIQQLMMIINRLYNIMFNLEERDARELEIKKNYIKVRI